MFLAGHAARVRMMGRAEGLAASMSRYLIDRIAALLNVELMTRTPITGLEGDAAGLERVRWEEPDGAAQAPIPHVFLLVGADLASEWLGNCGVALDGKGFVVTGEEGASTLVTTRAGVLAIGDVCAGSVKRVGGAIGEGAAVVAQIDGHLAMAEAAAPTRAPAAAPVAHERT